MNLEIQNYINQYKDKYPIDAIRNDLIKKGYSIDEIESVISAQSTNGASAPSQNFNQSSNRNFNQSLNTNSNRMTNKNRKSKTWIWITVIVVLLLLILGLLGYVFLGDKIGNIMSDNSDDIVEEASAGGDNDMSDKSDNDGYTTVSGFEEGTLLDLKIDRVKFVNSFIFPDNIIVKYNTKGESSVSTEYRTNTTVLEGGSPLFTCDSDELKLDSIYGVGAVGVSVCRYAGGCGSWKHASCSGDLENLSPGKYTLKLDLFSDNSDERYISTLETIIEVN